MPISLELNKFIDFAAKSVNGGSGDKSVVHLGVDGAMSTSKWRVFIRRSTDFKEQNLNTRRALLDALGKEFGGLDNLPQGVKDALKLDDFKLKNGVVTSRRPLTSRRISEIADAVRVARNLDAVVSRGVKTVQQSLEKLRPTSEAYCTMVKQFGKTPAEHEKAMRTFFETNPAAKLLVNPKPMGEEAKKHLIESVKTETKSLFTSALKEKAVSCGFSGDSLRVGTGPAIFSTTTINGKHVDPKEKYDEALLQLNGPEDQWSMGYDPKTVAQGMNASFYAKFTTLVPKENPNRIPIMKIVTSQLGLQGLSGDLNEPSTSITDKGEGIDFGFGNYLDLQSGKGGFRTVTMAPTPVSGTRDFSVKGNSLVITQRVGFGPQINMIGNAPVNPAGSKQEPFDASVYEVTKTITIPLEQPSLQPGEMPEYTIDVDVKMR